MEYLININKEIVKYVEEEILPRYDKFDAAHSREHIQTVIDNSMDLMKHFDVNPDMVYVIAAYHDLGIAGGRENHHRDSGIILENDAFLKKYFTPEQITVMKEAVEDHRASSKSEPRSIYGKIVAEADRNIVVSQVIRRIVQYGLGNYPEYSEEEQYARFKSHLENKYGRNGYLRLWLPQSPNAARLEELRRIIDDEAEVRRLFEKYYRQS